ncbi:MAG: thiamine pyrophosphate-binding protein [Deltaproteobacteria bacterium]|nr:thiamine pyrophosphate-binding protein [Deltaproteobacteria bacterium]
MSEIDGGALVGRALANEGIEKAFVLCGGHIMPIFYGMRDAGIEIVDMRHEAAAMYAATAYTRASGKTAVVLTTAGPGVGNTVAGMMEAQSLGMPLLQIGGAVASRRRDAGDLQDMSTLKVMESCSKWARKIIHTDRIPEYISMAFRHAHDSSPGPVYLEMPTDLLSAKVAEDRVNFPVHYRTDAIPSGDQDLIEKAAELLANAERPAIVVGDGARFSLGDKTDAVATLSDFLKAPLGIVGSACRGLFGDESRNYLLRMDFSGQADVVLALGCRFDFQMGMGRGMPADAFVIQVHTDMQQIGFNLRADMGIVGGSGPVAAQLLDAIERKKRKPAEESWSGLPSIHDGSRVPDFMKYDGVPIHPGRCAFEVAKFMEEEGADWNLAHDGGEAQVWMTIAASARRPGQIHATGATGTIGTGPALAIGAWVANRKPVLWFTGDGSFGFYPMELDTMARLGIPVVCVISNDSAWGMIKLAEKYIRPQEIESKGNCNVDLEHMRAYEKIVSMWDGHGERVTDPEEIRPAIRRAAANGKPSIINVEIDKVSLSPMIEGYADSVKGRTS